MKTAVAPEPRTQSAVIDDRLLRARLFAESDLSPGGSPK